MSARRADAPARPAHRQTGTLFLLFATSAAVLEGILIILARAELAQPGLQIFADAQLVRLLVLGSGSVVSFFVLIPALLGGFGHLYVPAMIGARDTAFPKLSQLAFWMLLPAMGLLLYALFRGDGASLLLAAGAMSLAGLSAAAVAINLVTTIFNMRGAGTSLRAMPLFAWSVLAASLLALLWLPVLAGAIALFGNLYLSPDVSETPAGAALQQHVLRFFAHPEVYFLILPAFGIISHIVASFSRKPVVFADCMTWATVAIAFIGFVIWAHFVYASAPGAGSAGYFTALAWLIAVPLLVNLICWTVTIAGGAMIFRTPMLWAVGFIYFLLVGGLTGVFRASTGLSGTTSQMDVVAHFDHVLSLGAIFAISAGWYYWFPKMTGYLYNETFGKLHFWITFIGVNLFFLPAHLLGAFGLLHVAYPGADTGWAHLSAAGSYIPIAAMAIFFLCTLEALMRRRPAGSNPWKATTPEWTEQPPPPAVAAE